MLIDGKKLLTLTEAFRPLPSPPSPATIWRWRTRGSNGAKLDCVRIGKRWYTSHEAVARFVAAQNRPTPTSALERAPETELRLRDAGLL